MSPFILEKRLSPFFLQTSPFCKKNGDICKINGDICKKNGDICKKNGDNLFCHRFCIPPFLRYCLNSATKFDATMFSPKGKTLLRRYFVAELYIRSTFVTRRLQVDFHYCDTMRTLLQQTSLTPNFCCNNFFHCCNKIFFLKIEFSRLLQQCHCCNKIFFLIFHY